VFGAALSADVDDIGTTDKQGHTADVPCGRGLTIQAPGFQRLTAVVDACAGPRRR
jgi:hypothetical protein